MRIFLPPIKTNIFNSALTDEEFLRKNVTYLDKMKLVVFCTGMDDKIHEVLTNLLKYFEEVEEYRYCSDILKIFEMNKDLHQNV